MVFATIALVSAIEMFIAGSSAAATIALLTKKKKK